MARATEQLEVDLDVLAAKLNEVIAQVNQLSETLGKVSGGIGLKRIVEVQLGPDSSIQSRLSEPGHGVDSD